MVVCSLWYFATTENGWWMERCHSTSKTRNQCSCCKINSRMLLWFPFLCCYYYRQKTFDHRIHTSTFSPSSELFGCAFEHPTSLRWSGDSRDRATGCWRVLVWHCRCFPGPQQPAESRSRIILWVSTFHEIMYCQWHSLLR